MAGAAASALLTAHSDHGSGAVREIAFDELAREGLMILVAGATGSLGGKIATGLQSSRQSVRALVRPTSNAESLANASAEASLRQSGISYTILQPNAFMDVWFGMLIEGPVARGQPVTLVRESKRRDSFIAERDVAAFAMAATDHPAARNTTMVLGGPDAVTFQEVVYAYETVLGRSIPIQKVAPGEPIPGLPQPVWSIAAALETFDSPVSMEATARTFGITLTSVNAFASTSRLASQT